MHDPGMIEACAQALRNVWMREGGRKPWDKLPEVVRQRYRDEAKAVLDTADRWKQEQRRPG